MSGRGSERRRLDGDPVLVRFTPDVAARVRAAASDVGLTSAAWIRARITEVVAAAPADAVPVRRYRAPKPPPTEAVVATARLRESVAEMTGALVKVAVRTREAGDGDLHVVVEALLPAIRQAVLDLDKVKTSLMGGRP